MSDSGRNKLPRPTDIDSALEQIRNFKDTSRKIIKRNGTTKAVGLTWKDVANRLEVSASALRCYISRNDLPLWIWNKFLEYKNLPKESVETSETVVEGQLMFIPTERIRTCPCGKDFPAFSWNAKYCFECRR